MNVLRAGRNDAAREKSRRALRLFALAACMLAACMLAVVPSRARAQSAATAPVKSPTAALIAGLVIPGAGHIYAGEPIRGFAIMAATAGVAAWALSASNTTNYDYTCSHGCIDTSKDPNYHTLEVGLTVAGAIWVLSAFDAPRAALRENTRSKLRQLASRGIPLAGAWSVAPTVVRKHGSPSPGLRFSAPF